jgi:hypothetical protein
VEGRIAAAAAALARRVRAARLAAVAAAREHGRCEEVRERRSVRGCDDVFDRREDEVRAEGALDGALRRDERGLARPREEEGDLLRRDRLVLRKGNEVLRSGRGE